MQSALFKEEDEVRIKKGKHEGHGIIKEVHVRFQQASRDGNFLPDGKKLIERSIAQLGMRYSKDGDMITVEHPTVDVEKWSNEAKAQFWKACGWSYSIQMLSGKSVRWIVIQPEENIELARDKANILN